MNARSTVLILIVSITALITGCQPDAQPASSSFLSGISGLRLDNILGEPEDAGFERAEQHREFIFPEDHGPHNRYRTEWWYLTAVLKDETGNEYGVQFTLFRQALSPSPTGEGPWHTGQAYLGHLAVADISTSTHLEAERFARGHPELAGVSTGTQFRALIEDWTLQGNADETLDLTLSASEADQFGLDIRVLQTGPIVLQGDRGLSRKGPDGASYYYSVPRMQLRGTINLPDRAVNVTGLGWLDREWSSSVLGEQLAGWDWFSLQLDDERSIMAFRLRRDDGERDEYDHGLQVNHQLLENQSVVGEGDPGIELLDPDDFTLTPTRFYLDARGISWPVSWILQVADEEFTINALLDQQTVDLSIIYWEGMVEVLDAAGNRSGLGYMELTGYAPGE